MRQLLLPYRPDRPLAEAQEQVGREVVAECNRVGILVLEPLFYQLDDPPLRPKLVLGTGRFAAMSPDLLKLPFPVDPSILTRITGSLHVAISRSPRCRGCCCRAEVHSTPTAAGGRLR